MNVRREIIRTGETVGQVVNAIADEIVTGILQPGTRLDEVSLAAKFDISRTPVREALGQLGAMGLVDRRPNRGAVVAELTRDYLASMFEAMAELEAVCARLSAQRMTIAERRRLEDMHHASRALVQAGAEQAYEKHNTAFHSHLYEGAHSPHIYELVIQTRTRLAPFRRAQFRLQGRLSKSWDEHDAIVDAIMQANDIAAEQAARDHVSTVGAASSEFANSLDD